MRKSLCPYVCPFPYVLAGLHLLPTCPSGGPLVSDSPLITKLSSPVMMRSDPHLTSPVPRLPSPVSRLPSPVSRLPSPSPVSRLPSPVSRLLFPVSRPQPAACHRGSTVPPRSLSARGGRDSGSSWFPGFLGAETAPSRLPGVFHAGYVPGARSATALG